MAAIVHASFKDATGRTIGTFVVYRADDLAHAQSVISRVRSRLLDEIEIWLNHIQKAMGAREWVLSAIEEGESDVG